MPQPGTPGSASLQVPVPGVRQLGSRGRGAHIPLRALLHGVCQHLGEPRQRRLLRARRELPRHRRAQRQRLQAGYGRAAGARGACPRDTGGLELHKGPFPSL